MKAKEDSEKKIAGWQKDLLTAPVEERPKLRSRISAQKWRVSKFLGDLEKDEKILKLQKRLNEFEN